MFESIGDAWEFFSGKKDNNVKEKSDKMTFGCDKYLVDGIQNFYLEVGEAACFAFCLLDVGKEFNEKNQPYKKFDVTETLYNACSDTSVSSIIYYNKNNGNDNNNFFVQDPAKLLQEVTGRKWDVRKVYDLSYKPAPGEYIIMYYEREKTGSVIGHFDRDNFHPWKDSATVKYGKLKSIRVCKVID